LFLEEFMTDKPNPEPQSPAGGEGEKPPPPFEPDEELITYLERDRGPDGEER